MLLKQTLQMMDLLDDAAVNGAKIVDLFSAFEGVEVSYQKVGNEKSSTDAIKILIKGESGHSNDLSRPTLGVLCRIVRNGARTDRISLVPDSIGAFAAV